MSDPGYVELTAEEAQVLWDGGCTIQYKLPGTYIDQAWHNWSASMRQSGMGPAHTKASGCTWRIPCEH